MATFGANDWRRGASWESAGSGAAGLGKKLLAVGAAQLGGSVGKNILAPALTNPAGIGGALTDLIAQKVNAGLGAMNLRRETAAMGGIGASAIPDASNPDAEGLHSMDDGEYRYADGGVVGAAIPKTPKFMSTPMLPAIPGQKADTRPPEEIYYQNVIRKACGGPVKGYADGGSVFSSFGL
jgi:hypothetical protein